MSQEPPEKMMFQLTLRRRGISDQAVLRAMEEVPREAFVAAVDRGHAYRDSALGIACGQTISQPFVVAYMTEQLQLQKSHKVLEIGTGSGYQAAVLSRLARRVYTIERFASLLKEAEARFHELRIHNITSKTADGAKGWKEQAPFDRIIVTAAADGVPQTLIDQLAEGGIMVVPVGAERGDQVLLRLVKKPDGLHQEILADVRFVPLVGGALPEEEGRAPRAAQNGR